MKNRHLLLLMFFLTLCVAASGQKATTSSYTIKGVLVDSLTNEGEPYATIRITKRNLPDNVLKMAVTDVNGKFQEKMNAESGDYVITLSSIGRTPVVKEFKLEPSVKAVNLGKLISSEAGHELEGVVVVAQKPLVKVDVDKIEYNIADDPDSKSNNILDMLRKVPLVTVDGEDNVQVNGSSSFKIHVNGKPNNMMSNNPKEVLKSMPANTIKYIEVITSPGAKYDAEGVGGILNIVTIGSGFEGYSATFSGNGRNTGAGGGVYAMIKQGKFTLSGNYNYDYHKSPRSYSESYRENYESQTEKYLETNSTSKASNKFQYGNMEASYEIDTLRLLTVSFGLYGGNNRDDSNGSTVMYKANHRDETYSYENIGNGKGGWYSISGNIDYQRTSRYNKARMITLSYKINSNPQTNNSYNDYADIFSDESREDLVKRLLLKNYHSNGKTNTMEQTFQVDYASPIGKLHTVEVGAKYILRRNTSDNKLYEADGGTDNYLYNENRSSDYQHLNHILSAYAGYTLKYKSFTFKPGLRYEQTIQRVKYIVGPGENFNTDYSDLIPSVSLGLKIGKMQNLRAGYNMRIWRPGIWSLNPYFNNQNPMFIQQGNADLKSEKGHSFDLAYSSFSAKFNANISLRHSFSNNSITNISRLITTPGGEIFDEDPSHIAPEGALYSTYANSGKTSDTGLSLYLNWNASSSTRIYMNARGSYNDLKSEAQDLHNFGWNGSCFAGIQQTIPGKIRVSLNAGGSTPRISLQGKGSGYKYYGLGLSRSFLKEERLSVNLYCNNIFNKYLTFNDHTDGLNFTSTNSSKWPNRSFGLSISYRIGELKASVKRAERGINNDDVKSGGENNAGGGGAM